MKISKGKWTSDNRPEDEQINIFAGLKKIAVIDYDINEKSRFEAYADAELIINAPDLLNTLILLVEHCNIIPNSHCPEDLNPFGDAVSLIKRLTE